MIKVSVLYPNEPGKKFDLDYYINKHIPMVHRLLDPLGLVRSEVEKGIGSAAPGAPPPFIATGHLIFNSIEAFQQAFGPHAAEIMGDIPNYTEIQPQVQIGEIVK